MVDRIARELMASTQLFFELGAVGEPVRALQVWMGVQKWFEGLHSFQCLFEAPLRARFVLVALSPC